MIGNAGSEVSKANLVNESNNLLPVLGGGLVDATEDRHVAHQ
jgi:hypothetical protein